MSKKSQLKKFSDAELSYLRSAWHSSRKEEITNTLQGHSWESIKREASKLGVSRAKFRSSNLSALLDDTLENAYWWGFLYADGYLSDRGSLVIQLSNLDLAHLKNIAARLGVSINECPGNMSRLDTMDKIGAERLRQKLRMNKRKTYNPPDNILFLRSGDMRTAFFVGFMDGDGSITYRKGKFQFLRAEMHGSWLGILQDMAENLLTDLGIRAKVSLNNRGYAQLSMYGIAQYMKLVEEISRNKLPALTRKWKHDLENRKANSSSQEEAIGDA